MTNAFEYGDTLLPQHEGGSGEETPAETNQPYINLATFRMVVLADEILESFFEADLPASFRLQPLPELELPVASAGILGDIWSSIATDSNKKIFNMFTDEIGKTIGKHHVIHLPSIGRITTLQEPKARESLLTPSMRSSASKSSLSTVGSTTKTESSSSVATPSTSTTGLSIDVVAASSKNIPPVLETGGLSAMPMAKAVNAVNAALMERTPFAIDDATEDDEDDEDDPFEEDNDQVMDEVDAFLEAHDSGLTEEDKRVASDLLNAKPVK